MCDTQISGSQYDAAAFGRSAFVAAFFAVHPLHVESVVWITERKDVLSTFFWMVTLLAYLAYVRRPGLGRYAWVRGKPNQAESHYDLGVLYRQKGNTQEAIQHLEAALRLVPDYADARRILNQIQAPIPPAPGQGGNRQ